MEAHNNITQHISPNINSQFNILTDIKNTESESVLLDTAKIEKKIEDVKKMLQDDDKIKLEGGMHKLNRIFDDLKITDTDPDIHTITDITVPSSSVLNGSSVTNSYTHTDNCSNPTTSKSYYTENKFNELHSQTSEMASINSSNTDLPKSTTSSYSSSTKKKSTTSNSSLTSTLKYVSSGSKKQPTDKKYKLISDKQ